MLAQTPAPTHFTPIDYLINPMGAMWNAAIGDDVVAAAYAMYYFNPLGVLEDVDDIEPLESAAYHCHMAGFIDAYGSYIWGLRQEIPDSELDNLITNQVNNYMPEPIEDIELLAMGRMPLPWMGFDWDYAYAETYASLRYGFELLANAVGLVSPENLDDAPYPSGHEISEHRHLSNLLADSLHNAGYTDIAAALRWMTGATVSDLLNLGYMDARYSEMEWPHIDEADVWLEGSRLCDLYTDYALKGITYLEETPELQDQLLFNSLLLTYQQTLEDHHVTVDDDSIREGLIWTRRNREDAPEPADDLDVLSFWHRA